MMVAKERRRQSGKTLGRTGVDAADMQAGIGSREPSDAMDQAGNHADSGEDGYSKASSDDSSSATELTSNEENSETSAERVDLDGVNSNDDNNNSENEEKSSTDEDSVNHHDFSDIDGKKLTNHDPKDPAKAKSMTGELCSFDLRNLLAINAHQMNASILYKTADISSIKDNEHATIPVTNMNLLCNENYLLEKATDGCSQLIRVLWRLPVERSDAGPLVKLPAFDESSIPRALPPPAPKKETKWERFAKEKGISLNKEKRSRKVWDDATGSWMFRHGYQKANDDAKEWPIMEVKDNEDPYEDPWERLREKKRARVEKNREQRLKNEERAGLLAKGTATRLLKNTKHRRDAGKIGGVVDRTNVSPAGVPVDLGKAKHVNTQNVVQRRGKESTFKALLATQRSTASLGKYDKMREGEPERKKSESRALKKRKALGSATDPNVMLSEHQRSLKLFKSVVEGDVKKEKDIKKGNLASGETAYDYEYNDGLGPSSFRKKKGRAGAGKLKKMTKKRAK